MDRRGWPTWRVPPVRPVECVSLAAEGIVTDVRLAAGCRAPVLVSASTPDAARAIAYEIHDQSPRAVGPFRAFRARGFPTDRGALHRTCRDLKRLSHWGTLYIDRVEEIPGAAVRVALEELFGANGLYDLRLICGTSVRLHDYVRSGLFDEAWFYRLNVVHIDALWMTSSRLES